VALAQRTEKNHLDRGRIGKPALNNSLKGNFPQGDERRQAINMTAEGSSGWSVENTVEGKEVKRGGDRGVTSNSRKSKTSQKSQELGSRKRGGEEEGVSV